MKRLAALLLCCLGLPALGAPTVTFRTPGYVARWTDDTLTITTPDGRLLTRWPVGAACQPADPERAALPQPALQGAPTVARAGGVTTLTWRLRLPPPWPFAEQEESYRMLPDRVEVRVRARWRTGARPSRLVRMVYGARLAPGCIDLEGLWEQREADGTWLPAPVPGVVSRTGMVQFRRPVRTASALPQLLTLGGVDEGDVARLDGSEVGRTDAVVGVDTWTKVRRYPVPAGSGERLLTVDVTNSAGNGGLWRGPCVLGPASALTSGDGWRRASAVGKALHHWCPDAYRQPLEGRFTVSLTSVDRTREAVPENVTTGGRFQLPPYVAAIEGAGGWWGLGTLDVPRAEDGLRIEWRDGSLACSFLLAPGSGPWVDGPRLAILTGSSKRDILRRYLAALPPRPARPRQPWWSGPEYCTWGDQCYASQEGGSDVGGLTDQRVRSWLGALDAARIAAPLVVLDAGWWQLSKPLVAELHAQGRNVVLWTQPHWQPDPARNAHLAMRDAAGRPWAYDPANWLLDYTLPQVRARVSADIRGYLSRDGWNADGLKLDFPYTAAPIWAVHADPTWGAGEQYRARALRWWYAQVKAAKPGALLTLGCANPLFGDVQDVCRLNEDWVGDPQLFRRRAEAVTALGEVANCDDWNAYAAYLPGQACERVVWGTFTLMSALWRGDPANHRAAIPPEWTRRLSALTRLAARAPVRTGERVVYDPARAICRRVDNRGRTTVEALRLRGGSVAQALVAVVGTVRIVTSIADGRLILPGLASPVTVTAVGHDGARRPAPWRTVPGGIELSVQDAAGGVMWYEVEAGAASGHR